MFLLSIAFGPVNFKWNILNGFLNKYGDLFSFQIGDITFTNIEIPDGSFDTSISGTFDPEAESHKLTIGLNYNHGDKSTTVLVPSMKMGTMELAGRTKVLFNDKQAEVVAEDYESEALLHARLLLTTLGLLQGDTQVTRMLENLSRRH